MVSWSILKNRSFLADLDPQNDPKPAPFFTEPNAWHSIFLELSSGKGTAGILGKEIASWDVDESKVATNNWLQTGIK